MNKALVIIDIQNDITKNYKDIIGNINNAIDWAFNQGMHVVYIRHENLSDGTRTFKPNTRGAELVSDLKMVSNHIFTKTKGNALTSEEFADFITKNGIDEFYVKLLRDSLIKKGMLTSCMPTEKTINHGIDTSYNHPIKKLPRNQNSPKTALKIPKPVALFSTGKMVAKTALITDS